ncbi:MAG TPA: hypothetical protein PK175_05360 [Syntrophales bacterium]|jgi:hypothetical protein|nr:hypothetical protein [Syntrophales bacterium]HON22635.1 hypothetical protein [Syntrophales bacterium]HOU76895.1 hypothetical protein [Syntrophales bacterium]HPC31664.1 hypothetical protein [Syntrophales bacterium]HQG34281.1 hypothetical protein [Syntrophales bacterium]
MTKKWLVLVLALWTLAGCGYYEGVVQPTPQSYLSFLGDTDGAVAVIDDRITLNLGQEMRGAENEKKTVLFQLSPGRHKVVVTKRGREVVNRIVIVGDGATKEIQVP